MKILIVIPTLGYGGAERLLVTLLPKLKDKKINIKVCTFSTPLDLASELENEGIPVVNLGLKHRWSVFEAIVKLYKEIKKFNPDIIWGHLYFGILYSRLVSLLLPNLNVISLLHYNISSDSTKKGLWYLFRNWLFDKSQRSDFTTVAVSNSVRKDYENFFGWKDIQVVYNAVDLEKMDFAIQQIDTEKYRQNYNISSNDYLIVVPGRLHRSKGHQYIIEAVSILKNKSDLMVKVIIAGEGSYKQEIEKLITKLDLSSQFIFTGNLEQTELFRVINMSDVVVIPSLFEAFGIVAIEAMYLMKSVIVTNVDGLKEITTDKIDAVQVPVKDSEAIARAIENLIRDPQYARFLADNAKQTALNFDVENISEQWINIFEKEII